MRKTDKKFEKLISQALSRVCDQALDDIEGFSWLTHQVNYQQFPQSLIVVCIFTQAPDSESNEAIKKQLLVWANTAFRQVGLSLVLSRHQLALDSEASCLKHHEGNWARRLQAIY